MFKKSLLAISALSTLVLPAAADSHRHDRYGYGYNGYAQQQGYYPQATYGYPGAYYGNEYGYRQHRCSGTTGTIIGAGAGALLGRSIGRGSYHRHSGTTGTILGAALGAVVGREVGKSTC